MNLLILSFVLLSSANALKLLFYNPKNSKSHVGFVNNVANSLLDAGHEIFMYMPSIDNSFGNGSKLAGAQIIERPCNFAKKGLLDAIKSDVWFKEDNVYNFIVSINRLGNFFKTSCMDQLADEAVMEQLQKENFDLGFSEFFDPCGFGIFQKIGLKKHILLYSTVFPASHGALFGIPPTTSFVPEIKTTAAPPFSFLQRFINQLNYLMIKVLIDHYFIGTIAEAFTHNNLNGDLNQMLASSSYFFVNTDELVDFPRPLSEKVVQIAGVGIKKIMLKQENLEKSLQDVFDNAKKGVVLISFGTVASSAKMPDNLKQAFLDAIKALPEINFFWKYEEPDDPMMQNLSNLFVSNWLPQKEILNQKKLLAFVTHGGRCFRHVTIIFKRLGMNSIVEATTSGIPIIVIPLFAEQYRNALMIQHKNVGIRLEKALLTKEALVDAIQRIINDTSFKKNALELSKMITNKVMSPEERIVKYTEFAAQFDVHKTLDLSGRNLTTIEFYNLDVQFVIFLIILAVLFVFFKVSSFMLKWLLPQIIKSKKD